MTFILLCTLTVLVVAILVWGMRQRDRLVQFPVLIAAALGGYLLPQFYALTTFSNLPYNALNKTIIMAILCLFAAFYGYSCGDKPVKVFRAWGFSYNRLVKVAMIMTLLGSIFYYKVSQMSAEVSLEMGGQWSGPITIYVFFSRLITIGFVIAILLHFHKASKYTLLTLCYSAIFYFDRIIFHGRRGDLIELAIILALTIYFRYRWVPPRVFATAFLAVTILFINSIGDYRSTMLETDRTTYTGSGISEILSIDFIGNFKNSFTLMAPDVINAVYLVNSTDKSLDFDYGTSLLNDFITRYFPGQLFGYSLKNSLKINLGNQSDLRYDYIRRTGTTNTGIASAFQSYWYFGAIIFWLIGYLMRRWFVSAVQGNFPAQCIILLISYSSLRSMPFSTNRFFLEFVTLAFFLFPALLWARKRSRPRILRSCNCQ